MTQISGRRETVEVLVEGPVEVADADFLVGNTL
jgi:hypothetical protein